MLHSSYPIRASTQKKKKKGKNLGKSFFKKNSYLVNKSN